MSSALFEDGGNKNCCSTVQEKSEYYASSWEIYLEWRWDETIFPYRCAANPTEVVIKFVHGSSLIYSGYCKIKSSRPCEIYVVLALQ